MKKFFEQYEELQEVTTITRLTQEHGEAWKEKGIIESLIARMIPADSRSKTKWLADGHDLLSRVTLLIPAEFDVWSSLAGVLKNMRNTSNRCSSHVCPCGKDIRWPPLPVAQCP